MQGCNSGVSHLKQAKSDVVVGAADGSGNSFVEDR